MSDGGRDLAKGAVLTLLPTGLGFILSGWIVGAICLFAAGGLSLILWTPLGVWLGFQAEETQGEDTDAGLRSFTGDLAAPRIPSQAKAPNHSGRIYGGAEIGAAIRKKHAETKEEASFLAVEAEIALAYEEALEMTKILRAEWPHITPDGALVQVTLPDWRTKTTTFIGTALGSAQRAAFKGSGRGSSELERLETEGEFLRQLAVGLSRDAIRPDEGEILEARAKRREHDASQFLKYDHARISGAPDPQ